MRVLILLCFLLIFTPATLAAGLTLDEALGQATPPAQGGALSVDAGKVRLPAGTVLPGTKLTVADAASLYNRASQEFGTVRALAPPTMTVLNTAPGEPNIYAGMPPLDAFTLLLASLSERDRLPQPAADLCGPAFPRRQAAGQAAVCGRRKMGR